MQELQETYVQSLGREDPQEEEESMAMCVCVLTARRPNQSILKEISPEYSLEGLMLKLKLQYFGHLM